MPIQLEDLNSTVVTDAIKRVIEDKEMRGNVTFYSKLLAEDERISLMDLEYFLDYVYQFGAQELIPLYDKMAFVEYRNWDVYTLIFFALLAILYIWFRVLSFCCGLCKSSKK